MSRLSIYPHIYPFICLPGLLKVCLNVCLNFVSIYVCHTGWLSVCLRPASLPTCLSVNPWLFSRCFSHSLHRVYTSSKSGSGYGLYVQMSVFHSLCRSSFTYYFPILPLLHTFPFSTCLIQAHSPYSSYIPILLLPHKSPFSPCLIDANSPLAS